MSNVAAVLIVSVLALAACQSQSKNTGAALTQVSSIEERIIADFSLGDVPHSPTGYVDFADVDLALKKRFPKEIGRSVVTDIVAAKEWPKDVVVLKEKDAISVYYYRIGNSTLPWVARYAVRFRFSSAGSLDRVDLGLEYFEGGIPAEMPKSLLKRPNQTAQTTPGSFAPLRA